jgi:hypothetical protein
METRVVEEETRFAMWCVRLCRIAELDGNVVQVGERER